MEIFQTLGIEVEALWRDQNYNEEIFPEIAAEVLNRSDLPSKVSAWEILEWTVEQTELPRQKDPHASFGDPPITLFVGPRFYIDAYVWLEGTTAIHQHSFCGAFQVLLGSSIHSWYDFDVREKISSFFELGDLKLRQCELLKLGNVQKILAGRQYIHSLFHLDQPSMTIVIRTDRSPLYLPQFSYHKPTLAADPFYEHETTTRKLQTLSAMFRAKYQETPKVVEDLLAKSDLHTAYLVLRLLYDRVRSDQIGQMFGLNEASDRFERFLAIVRERHGSRADELAEVFKRESRSSEIVSRRRVVADPEHRFFLALVLNIDSKEDILRLVRQRFPDIDPVEKILDWSFDLAQTKVVGMNIPNALGVPDFDDFALSVLECLLRGRNEEIAADLTRDHPTMQSNELSSRIALVSETLRSSAIFSPLLSEHSGVVVRTSSAE